MSPALCGVGADVKVQPSWDLLVVSSARDVGPSVGDEAGVGKLEDRGAKGAITLVIKINEIYQYLQ